MPIRPCPTCQRSTPKLLPEASITAIVNYYRCDHCGHVWSVLKVSPHGPHRTVAPGILPEEMRGDAPGTHRRKG